MEICTPSPMQNSYSAETYEAIGLSVAFEALRSLVNHGLMHFAGVSSGPSEVEARFKSSTHRDLFHIRLLDFVHEPGDKDLLGEKLSCLGVLELAGAKPLLATADQGVVLAKAASDLRIWLDHEIVPKLWLARIDLEVRLSVSRLQLLKIAGNQAKHNLSRLTGVSMQIKKLLADNGHDVPLAQIPFVLDDFRAHVGENILIYYGSWAAELINNLTWALFRYIEPIYQQRIIRLEEETHGMYRFEPLPGVDPLSTDHCWLHRLLNEARSPPCVRPFTAARSFRGTSSLEWEYTG